MGDCHGCPAATITLPPVQTRRQIVAIVGPPNSGKSTLFNRLTGLRQKVANFPGVTVEHRMGRAKLDADREVFLVDLPGIYSMNPRSEDERVTHDVLSGTMKDMPRPDAVLLILDSTNLSRHLVLAAPVLSLNLPTLVILNMADDLGRRGGEIDSAELAMQLGAPVALVSASRGDGVDKVFQFLAGTTLGAAPPKRLMELPVIQDVPKCRAWAANIGDKTKYHAPAPPLWTRRLDSVFLHPIIGPLVFVLVVIGVFETIFSGARPIMDAVDAFRISSGNWIGTLLPNAALRSLVVDGVWKGVGSVIQFLPQILLLFLFIGILEDSGYLARAALIADRTMSRFGLQGKSFIPLLSAYACAVPAIMATRTIENKRDRIATILIAPFMTCSARLPVYTLVIAAFIPNRRFAWILSTQVAAMLGLYIIGFLAAITTARLLKSTVLKSTRSSFMLEMPPYRWPTFQSLGLRLVDRSKVFLRRAGTVILVVAVVIWVLSYFPLNGGKQPPIEQSFAGMIGHAVEPAIKPLGFNWKIGIGLITSLAAREVIVATLGTIYGVEEQGQKSEGLQDALRHDLTPGGAAALLVFFAFAMQCMSTIAVVRRETGGWTWPAVQFAYMTVFAYVGALVANRVVTFWL
ncbi:MAG TPA: ferrous iron transport protein B [Bryobacteraceae bacterium]|nr:ferrous iron transport protein B [Bryobacteraceae bacterium]